MNITIAMPSRNRITLANGAINSILNSCDHKVLIVDDNSDRPDAEYISNKNVEIVYNKIKKGLSSLWNQILKTSDTEVIIFICDKIRVTEQDIKRIETNLQKGFACVATYRMGIFGISKELTTKIGFFDEGYEVNGYEDTDFMNKLFINNLALYISCETEYLNIGSGWDNNNSINAVYYNSKWVESKEHLIQKKEDVNYLDKFYFNGKYPKKEYATWDESVILVPNIKNFYSNRKGVKYV